MTESFNPDLNRLIRGITNLIYYVTEEEDQLLLNLKRRYGDKQVDIQVWYPTQGLRSLDSVLAEFDNPSGPLDPKTADIHDTLIKIHRDVPKPGILPIYVILDPDRILKDPQVVRRVTNLAHQFMGSTNNPSPHSTKIIIFAGPVPMVPRKLQRYLSVVHDKGLSDEELTKSLASWAGVVGLNNLTVDPDTVKAFRGLTCYEARNVFSLIVAGAGKNNRASLERLDLDSVATYKRQQLNKTELADYLLPDTTFEQVGGLALFKEWARRAKASWTEEGQAFGLLPPKGVLLVGAWGCGKSLSTKALAAEWGIPMIQLSMGRIRSSGVGETEANMRQVLSLVESVAPCILWLDEAEKEMSGGASSASSDAGTTSRVIGIFSSWMQETKAHVCLAMTANGVDTLPVELINRADERFFFDLPSEDERIEVLKIHLAKRGQDPSKFNLAKLADASDKMVGREIEQAINAALTDSFHAKAAGLDEQVLMNHLGSKPRIYRTMQDDMQKIITWVGHDPDLNEGIRARYASPRVAPALKLVKS